MLDVLFKNKKLTAVAVTVAAFYAYSQYLENKKLNLEIEMLTREVNLFDQEFGKRYLNGMDAVNQGRVGVI